MTVLLIIAAAWWLTDSVIALFRRPVRLKVGEAVEIEGPADEIDELVRIVADKLDPHA